MDDVLQALADPIRRKILRMIKDQMRTAGAIAASFSVSRPAVSRHLRVLRMSGLVHDKVEGRERVYRLNTEPLAQVETYLSQLRSVEHAKWEQRFMALETEVHRTRGKRKATSKAVQTDERKKTG